MLPANMLRKQGWCCNTHPAEMLVVLHLCKRLVLLNCCVRAASRLVLQPLPPWWLLALPVKVSSLAGERQDAAGTPL